MRKTPFQKEYSGKKESKYLKGNCSEEKKENQSELHNDHKFNRIILQKQQMCVCVFFLKARTDVLVLIYSCSSHTELVMSDVSQT